MSQFWGSFCALTKRSLLTVILYCAAGWDAVSAVIDTPAIAAHAIVTSLWLRYCMTCSSHEAARALRLLRGADRYENPIRETPTRQCRQPTRSDGIGGDRRL